MTKHKDEVTTGTTNLNTDNVEQSERTGTVQTEEGLTADAKTGVVASDPAADKARTLSYEEAEALVGELEPGDEGYVPLNEKGEIIGAAKKGKPPEGVLAAKVVAPVDSRPHPLQTPSGAHLSKRMNPQPALTERPEHTDLG